MASTTCTYAILTGGKDTEGSIAYHAQHSLIPAAQILESAQAWVYARLRVREMQAIGTFNFAAGDSSKALPTGFQANIKLELDGIGKLTGPVLPDNFPRDIDSDGALSIGTPSCWTIIGTTLYLDAELDADQNARLWYFGTPAALSASNPTNFLTDRWPTLLISVCNAFAYKSRHRGEDMKNELALAGNDIAEINADDEMARRGQVL